jgi:AsmA protein
MKRLVLIAAGLVVVLLAVAAVAAWNLDAFVNANRDAIAAQVEAGLGREVAFGEIGVSFRGGLGVRVADLRIGDDPAYSQEDFVRAEAVEVRVALLPALFGRIEVSKIALVSPRLRVIQTAKGLSTDSLGGGAPAAAPGEPGTPDAPAPPALFIALLQIEDGELRYVDRTARPEAVLDVTRLDVTVSELSPTRPVAFEARAAVFGSDARNLELDGRVGPLDAQTPQLAFRLRLDPLPLGEAAKLPAVRAALPADFAGSGPVRVEAEAEGTLEALAFRSSVDARGADLRLGEGFTKPAGVPFEARVRGQRQGARLEIEAADLVYGETRLEATASVPDVDRPSVEFTARSAVLAPAAFGAGAAGDALRGVEAKGNLAFPDAGTRGTLGVRSASGSVAGTEYADLAADVKLAGPRLTLERLAARAFDGTLGATGSLDTSRPNRTGVALVTTLSGVLIEQVLEAQAQNAAGLVSGRLDSRLDITGTGSDWEALQRTLTGTGSFQVKDGVLHRFNPAGEALDAVLALSTLSGSRLGRVAAAYPKVFGKEDAPFEMMEAKLDIRDGWIRLRDFVLDAADYRLAGEGRYAFDGRLEAQTQLAFSQALSAELIDAEPQLRYLRTAGGSVEIPLALRGTASKVAVVPDVSRLAGTAAREAIFDAVGRGLGVPAGGTAAAPESGAEPGVPAEAAPAKPEDVGRELLERGLGELLGGSRKKE